MAEPYCQSFDGGSACVDAAPYRPGFDTNEYVAFDLYGYEWAGMISCRDNPSTYTWEFVTKTGYAPNSILREFSSAYCEGRLYG
jgi:hypothetical protein